MFDVGLTQNSEIAKGSQKYRELYSEDVSVYSAFKGEPFYDHLLHINRLYLEMQGQDQKKPAEVDPEILGLKSSLIFDQLSLMNDLALVKNSFDFLPEFDA